MIKGAIADLIVSAYLLATLFLRFTIESTLTDRPLLSIILGVVMLVFIWALIKTKIIQPHYFGLLRSKQEAQQEEEQLFI